MKQPLYLTKPFLVGSTAPGSGPLQTRSYLFMQAPGTGVGRVKPAILKIQNGTAYSIWRQTIGNEQCQITYRRTFPPYDMVTEYFPTTAEYSLGKYADPLETETTLLRAAQNEARSKARGRSANLANMLAEYRQASDLFVTLVERTARLVQAVKHRDPRILLYYYWHHQYSRYGGIKSGITKRTLDNLAREWLQLVYGLKPLMSDMDQVMKELRSRTDRSAPSIRVAARKMERTSKTFTANNTYGNRKVRVVQNSQKSVNVISDITVRNDLLNSSLGAYGFTNPLGVAWEILPFSFVIDWWINVGEILESLDNCLYFDGASWAQDITRYKQTQLVSTEGGSGYCIFESYGRSSPYALGTVASPILKTSVSAMHIANGLALLRVLSR